MKTKSIINSRSGFTLIEMIGVIAIIAILAAFITPKVFEVINDSKVTRFAGEVNGYKSAVTNWYKDIGTIAALTAGGAEDTTENNFHDELISNNGTTTTSGLWANWNGPYIDSVANISLGTGLDIQTQPGASGTSTPVATDGTSFDLDDDGANDMENRQVVAIELAGVSATDCVKLDGIIDKGLTASAKATSGKVKYSGTTMYIYLTSL
ncbi:type II secretory system protein [Candidatus Scalindua japonica]|uniref:Type II secretory system protein n=1 Tax=Candidatus Scalindua japonica TaxID=1284222 RepID=A0A286U3H7_9BACT|nr:prepilin-type N-terminal cleavage/methylation domain-containing protein [Candidatus Scalindua japonica]GAX62687.1 type II secretory system protein [Candidatus Scalindua japonica]